LHLLVRLDTPLRRTLAACLLACLIWLPLRLIFAGAFQTIEERSGDWVWRLSASSATERRVVLVDIDEASLHELGPWPWPRARLAELSGRLASAGAALQVFDIVLAAQAPADDAFAARLVAGSGVLAQVFALHSGSAAAAGQLAGALPWPACPANLLQAVGYLGNPPAYATLPTGHITPQTEADGVMRRQPALICSDGKVYPALFYAALAQVLPGSDTQLVAGTGPLAPAWWLTGHAFGPHGIPLDASANVRIPWHLTSDAFVSISARDLLAGRVPAELLNNAWVVVGGTALGLNDRIATPLAGNVSGFVVHAQLLRGAIDDQLPIEPVGANLFSAIAAVLGALLLAGLGRTSRAPVSLVPVAGVGLALAFYGFKALLLLRAGYWLPWVDAAGFVLLFAASHSLVGHARHRFERERLYRHLASYLPGPVAAVLAGKDPSDTLDAERAIVTVLHADIRNFSAYCESRPPEEATAVLHAFFSMATVAIEGQGGMVESFQGDAVLAVWNGTDPRHAERALEAALKILAECRTLLPQNPPDELAPLAVGIGLETGLATVGSFGLARRRTHMAMGRTVTTAARLQEMTAELAHPILLGEGIAAEIGPHRLESQGTFLLEGLNIPCHIYAYPLRECL